MMHVIRRAITRVSTTKDPKDPLAGLAHSALASKHGQTLLTNDVKYLVGVRGVGRFDGDSVDACGRQDLPHVTPDLEEVVVLLVSPDLEN